MNSYARINAVGFTLLWPWAAAAVFWMGSLGQIDWRWLVAATVLAQLTLAAAQWRLVHTEQWFKSAFATAGAGMLSMLVGALAEMTMKRGEAVLSADAWTSLNPLSIASPWLLLMAAPLLLPPLHLALRRVRVTQAFLHGLIGAALVAAVAAGLFWRADGLFESPLLVGMLCGTAAGATAYRLLMRDSLQPQHS